jgi:hypothetical protein
MDKVVGNPIMIPCPTYDKEGENLRRNVVMSVHGLERGWTYHHNHLEAKLVPKAIPIRSNTGMAYKTGNQKLAN